MALNKSNESACKPKMDVRQTDIDIEASKARYHLSTKLCDVVHFLPLLFLTILDMTYLKSSLKQ